MVEAVKSAPANAQSDASPPIQDPWRSSPSPPQSPPPTSPPRQDGTARSPANVDNLGPVEVQNLICSSLFKGYYNKLSNKEKFELNNRGFSTFHAIVAAAGSLYLVVFSGLFADPEDGLIINKSSNLSNTVMGVSIGYFLSDLSLIIYHYPAFGGIKYKFAEINNAYEVLSDSEKRGIYHRYGEDGLKQHAANGGELFFGGGSTEEEEKVVKGDDVIVELDATLEDLYMGGTLKVWRVKNVIKPASVKRRCNCRNEVYHKQIGPGMFQQMTEQVCEQCPNVKYEREGEFVTVDIEKGM
ncbi:hypothetical protein CASFOL_019943 [Castilleja foliolosa]|uniref:TLC domain-containing protein n=1 Tax=Castilleja foliolosa TaxID=1961234 RepID=A0ABD3D2Z6_9LAMI